MLTDRQTRIVSVDFWRGVALASIFINHIPGNPLEPLTHKNFGFSDAAEIFVFLAGVGAAFVYAGRVAEQGFARPAGAILVRVVQLYMAHLTVLLACGAVVAFAVLKTNDIRLLEATQFDQIIEAPIEALIGLATLGLQPAYLNILPLYVALLLIAPAMISLAVLDVRLALLASATLYVGTQLLHLALPGYAGHAAWYFNPLAWQFLFVIGLVCGMIARRGRLRTSPTLLTLALAYLIGSLVWVRVGFLPEWDFSPVPRFIWDFDKTQLWVPRLLHALALIYVVSRLPLENVLRSRLWAQPMVILGRHSLPVFCVGTVLSIAAQVFRISIGGGAPGLDIALLAIGLMLQFGVAAFNEWQRTGVVFSGARTGSRQPA